MDIYVICFVLVNYLVLIPFAAAAVANIFEVLSNSSQVRLTHLRVAGATLLIHMITISGLSGMLGLLSVFQSNLTKTKRVVLLVICLLPMTFTILALALMIDKIEESWSLMKLGLMFSFISFVFNGPAIIVGRHLFQVMRTILRTLRLLPGNHAG